MELRRGYIRVPRDLFSSPIWKSDSLLRFYIWALGQAAYAEGEQFVSHKSIRVSRGQFVYSRRKAAKATGLSERTCRSCLNALCNMGVLAVHTQQRAFTIVSVLHELEEQTRAKQAGVPDPVPEGVPEPDPANDPASDPEYGKKKLNEILEMLEEMDAKKAQASTQGSTQDPTQNLSQTLTQNPTQRVAQNLSQPYTIKEKEKEEEEKEGGFARARARSHGPAPSKSSKGKESAPLAARAEGALFLLEKALSNIPRGSGVFVRFEDSALHSTVQNIGWYHMHALFHDAKRDATAESRWKDLQFRIRKLYQLYCFERAPTQEFIPGNNPTKAMTLPKTKVRYTVSATGEITRTEEPTQTQSTKQEANP